MNRFFHTLMFFVISGILLLLGGLCLLLPWQEATAKQMLHVFLNHRFVLSLFGFSFVLLSLVVLTDAVRASKRQYYTFTLGKLEAKIDAAAIKQAIEIYLSKIFFEQEAYCEIEIKSNALFVTLDLPHVPTSEREAILEKIQTELSDLLEHQFGYTSASHFFASFQPKSPTPISP